MTILPQAGGDVIVQSGVLGAGIITIVFLNSFNSESQQYEILSSQHCSVQLFLVKRNLLLLLVVD